MAVGPKIVCAFGIRRRLADSPLRARSAPLERDSQAELGTGRRRLRAGRYPKSDRKLRS